MTPPNNKTYWTNRYKTGQIGWNIGYPSTPIQSYIDQLGDKSLKILIPGAGNGYEAEYLFKQGFQQVHVVDIALPPLDNLQKRIPEFPAAQILHQDFFELEGQFDLIIEQTFFCAIEYSQRPLYAKKVSELLKPKGKLVGLLFKHPYVEENGRPWGGNLKEYQSYFKPYFDTIVFEDCYNSIKPRYGNEYFFIVQKK